MAHEGSFGGERGQTDFWVTVEKNDSGTMKVYDVAAGSDTFVVWNTADQDDYDITPAEASPGKYTFTFPADISAGDYLVSVRKGSKADADETAIVTHCDSAYWDETVLTRLATLVSSGLDIISTAEPSGDPSGWNWREKLRWLIARFANRTTKSATQIIVRNESDTQITTQEIIEGAAESVAKIAEP